MKAALVYGLHFGSMAYGALIVSTDIVPLPIVVVAGIALGLFLYTANRQLMVRGSRDSS